MNADVLIIGGGLAGLTCAKGLEEASVSYLLLEAEDDIGGRVRTDQVNGFLLDRGFQVFPTAYPEATAQLDYSTLKLHHFSPGAMIRSQGKWHRMLDPFRSPLSALSGILSPIGTLSDKFRVAQFRSKTLRGSIRDIFSKPEMSILQHLQNARFSSRIIEQFFRPFFGGIFLDTTLQTSSRMAEFIFRMFASGNISLPAAGMGAIPQQLRSHLSSKNVRTQARVTALQENTAILSSGESLSAKAIVVATEGPSAAQLVPSLSLPPYQRVSNLYFAAAKAPIQGPYLLLNGEGVGPINNLCILTQVAPTYSETAEQLVSVSVIDGTAQSPALLEKPVRNQLLNWFGPLVNDWKFLQASTIKAAQPQQLAPFSSPYSFQPHLGDRLFICGDCGTTGTIDGALYSGRRAAEEVQAWLAR